MYNFSDKTTKAVFSGFNSTAICRGPENSFFASSSNTVFSVSDSNNVSELQWQNDELVLVRTFAPQSSTFGHVETMSYSAHLRAVIQGGYRTFRAFTFPAETEALSLTEIVLPGPLKSIQNLFNSSSLFRSNKHFNIKSLSSDAAGQLYLSLHAWTGNFEPGVYRLDPVTGQTLCLFHTFPHGLCLHNSHGLFAMEGDRIERYNLSVVSYRKSTPLWMKIDTFKARQCLPEISKSEDFWHLVSGDAIAADFFRWVAMDGHFSLFVAVLDLSKPAQLLFSRLHQVCPSKSWLQEFWVSCQLTHSHATERQTFSCMISVRQSGICAKAFPFKISNSVVSFRRSISACEPICGSTLLSLNDEESQKVHLQKSFRTAHRSTRLGLWRQTSHPRGNLRTSHWLRPHVLCQLPVSRSRGWVFRGSCSWLHLHPRWAAKCSTGPRVFSWDSTNSRRFSFWIHLCSTWRHSQTRTFWVVIILNNSSLHSRQLQSDGLHQVFQPVRVHIVPHAVPKQTQSPDFWQSLRSQWNTAGVCEGIPRKQLVRHQGFQKGTGFSLFCRSLPLQSKRVWYHRATQRTMGLLHQFLQSDGFIAFLVSAFGGGGGSVWQGSRHRERCRCFCQGQSGRQAGDQNKMRCWVGQRKSSAAQWNLGPQNQHSHTGKSVCRFSSCQIGTACTTHTNQTDNSLKNFRPKRLGTSVVCVVTCVCKNRLTLPTSTSSWQTTTTWQLTRQPNQSFRALSTCRWKPQTSQCLWSCFLPASTFPTRPVQ